MWPPYSQSDSSQWPAYRMFVCLSHCSSSSGGSWDYHTTFTLQRGTGAEWNSCCGKMFPMAGNILLYSTAEYNWFLCYFSVCGRRSSTNSTQLNINTTQLSINSTQCSINTTQQSNNATQCSTNSTPWPLPHSRCHTLADPASAGGKSFDFPTALSFETRRCRAGSGVSQHAMTGSAAVAPGNSSDCRSVCLAG